MNGCSPSRAMPQPLTTPASAPRAITAGIVTASGQPASSMIAITTAVSASSEPTDRSMPPVRITNVIPTARTPTIDA